MSIATLCQVLGSLFTQVMYFSSLFPYVVLFCFLVRGLMLRGAVDGIAHMFTPKVREKKTHTKNNNKAKLLVKMICCFHAPTTFFSERFPLVAKCCHYRLQHTVEPGSSPTVREDLIKTVVHKATVMCKLLQLLLTYASY